MERTVQRFAWPLAILSGAITAAGLTLLVLTLDQPTVARWGFRGFEAIFAVEAILIGALIMSRRPENVIGVLFAVVGLLSAIQLLALQYLVAGANGGLPLMEWVSLVYAPIWVPIVALLVGYLPLLFPDGRLASRRWRWAVYLVTVAMVSVVLLALIGPDPVGGGSTVPFPYPPLADGPTVAVPFYVAYGMLAIGIAAGFGSLWVRWRRSIGVEREQLKWLAWAGGIVVVVLPFTFLPTKVVQYVFIGAIALVPLAVGIAVLRYRLYEIDTVISRTIVYGGMTAILAGLFAGLQRIIQGAFVSVTGNESDAAWAITALVLAAAFSPIKGALERFVAARFKDPLTPRPGQGAAPPGIDPPLGTAEATEDLEAMVRRVVREELAVAMSRPTDQG